MDTQEKLVMAGMASSGFMDQLTSAEDEVQEPEWIRNKLLATRHVSPVEEAARDNMLEFEPTKHPWRAFPLSQVEYQMAQEDLLDVRSIKG